VLVRKRDEEAENPPIATPTRGMSQRLSSTLSRRRNRLAQVISLSSLRPSIADRTAPQPSCSAMKLGRLTLTEDRTQLRFDHHPPGSSDICSDEPRSAGRLDVADQGFHVGAEGDERFSGLGQLFGRRGGLGGVNRSL
jgi:hypothetical protein